MSPRAATTRRRKQGASPNILKTLRLGRILKQLRESRGLTFDALSAACGVSRTYLWGLERGRFDNPSRRICTRIAVFYDVPVSTLLDEADGPDGSNGIVTWETISKKAETLTQSQLKIVDAVVDGLRGAAPQ